MRSIRRSQIVFLIIFVALILASAALYLIYQQDITAQALLVLDFAIAVIFAVYSKTTPGVRRNQLILLAVSIAMIIESAILYLIYTYDATAQLLLISGFTTAIATAIYSRTEPGVERNISILATLLTAMIIESAIFHVIYQQEIIVQALHISEFIIAITLVISIKPMRSMRRYQLTFLTIFIAILMESAILSLRYQLRGISQMLLASNFIIAIIVAVYGSLNIRQEEEERAT
jgi:uncharacterized membrane protein